MSGGTAIGIERKPVCSALIVLTVMALFFSVFLCIIPEDSSADSGVINGLNWELESNTLTITGEGVLPDFEMSEDTRPWTVSDVHTLIIGEGVTSTGDYVFSNHPNLQTVTIRGNITHIKPNTFLNCISLYTVEMPDNVERIWSGAFSGCNAINQISFGNITIADADAFDGLVFEDRDDIALPKTAANLSNIRFIRAFTGQLKIEEYRIYFDTKGGSPIQSTYVAHGNLLSEPASPPTRGGYSFDGWYSDEPCTILYNFSTAVTASKTIYAGWAELPPPTYPVRFVSQGVDYQVYDLTIGSPIPTPATNPVKDSDSDNDYSFSHWEGYTETLTTAGASFNAVFTAIPHTYAVKFVSEGSDFRVLNLHIGDAIPKPTDNPTKSSDSKYEYPFSHWEGYTDEMTLSTAGTTFTAVFDKMIILNKDGSRLTLVDSEESKMEFTSDRIDMIVTMANTDPELTMSVNLENCLVHFDNVALRSLKIADAELSVSKLSYDDLSEAQKKLIGNHTVYDMKFGDNTDFKGGKVTFTLSYALEDGKNADDLYVAYVSDGSVAEELECDYEDGKLTFSTGHLSIYTFFYREAKKTGFLTDLDFGSFLTIGVILAIALSGIILFVLKKLK